MLYRKPRNQWLLMPVLMMLMFSGLFLLTRNHRSGVYYVESTTTALAPSRHVTKSLSELGKMDEINKYVLLLNHAPNCGAELLVFLLQKLQGANNYRHVRLKGAPRLDRIRQEEFVDELYRVVRNAAVPLSFDRQLYFINFTVYDRQSPTFINLIREPADKVISRSLYSSKQRNDDLIECVIRGGTNCTGMKVNPLDLTVPYFCGNDPKCFSNDRWALQTAKVNVEKYYLVVGVLEELKAALEVFEHKIPYFFKGVQNLYIKNIIDKLNRNRGVQSEVKIRKQLKRVLEKEYEFYNWIKGRFFKQLQTLHGDHH